jgi:hypothetical protein
VEHNGLWGQVPVVGDILDRVWVLRGVQAELSQELEESLGEALQRVQLIIGRLPLFVLVVRLTLLQISQLNETLL